MLIINLFIFFFSKFFFFGIDCTEVNVTESAWTSTTETLDATTIQSLLHSSHLDGTEDFTTEGSSATDNNYETTTTSTTTNPPRSSRRKRHINFPGSNSVENNAYTMEVMVAVDRKMQEYHGNNIQAYVLTLMSIVSNIYADASIGNSINVAVVHILYLRDDLHMESNNIGKLMLLIFLI